MGSAREVIESPFEQGASEAKAYKIPAVPTSWGNPEYTNHDGKLYEELADGTFTDVTGTNVTGSQTSSTAAVSTGRIHSLTIGKWYRYEGEMDNDEGDTVDFYFRIFCKR